MEKQNSFFSVDFMLVVAVLLSIALVGYNAFLLPDYEPPVVTAYRAPNAPAQAGPATETAAGVQAEAPADAAFTVNINTADSTELQRVPGIGPAMAQKLLDFRARVGVITDLSQLLEVSGIGEKKLEQFAPYLVLKGS